MKPTWYEVPPAASHHFAWLKAPRVKYSSGDECYCIDCEGLDSRLTLLDSKYRLVPPGEVPAELSVLPWLPGLSPQVLRCSSE